MIIRYNWYLGISLFLISNFFFFCLPLIYSRLIFLDGLLSSVTNNQPSSSSSSSLELERSSTTTTTAAESLYSQYQRLTFDVNNE